MTASLTRDLVTLKLRLIRNGLRRSTWQLVGLILGALYGLGLVVAGLIGLVALRGAPVAEAAAVTSLVFAAVTLGWIIAPLLLFGTDETLDPGRFALLPLRARELLPGFTLASLVGLPGVGTVVFALGLLGTWSRGPLVLLAALVSIVVGVVLCVLWSRTLLTWLAALLAGRRTRDLTVVVFMVIVMGFALAAQGFGLVSSQAAQNPDVLLQAVRRAGTIAGWMPFGWIWSLPGAVAQGQWLSAGLRLLLSLALAGGLAWLWQRRLGIALTSPIETAGGGHAVRSGIGRWLPATPTGAIATRTLLYWRRDPRYLIGIVAFIMLPIIMAVSTRVGGGGQAQVGIVFTPLLLSALAGASIVSDAAYDNSALALHVLTGVTGAEDRRGRMISYLLVLTPLVAITAIVMFVIGGRPEFVAPVTALLIVTLLSGIGAGLWVGAFMPGKAPPPGANALAASNNGSLKAMLALTLCMLVLTVASIPTAVLAILALTWQAWLGWVALAVGLVSGVGACAAGIRLGGRIIDRRWPELLADVSS